MKYYQLFYNASECGLSGNPGFGVRTATEGIPQEYLAAIENDESLLSYQSGNLDVPASDILAHPEAIFQLPRTYFYREEPVTGGKSIYVVGRIVSVCFDFPFYRSGSMTRQGNIVNHVFIFEEKPGKEVFDLLLEAPDKGAESFLPKNWTPKIDNQEMLALMLGKPTELKEESKGFVSGDRLIPEESYSLFFQILARKGSGKPFVVRTKADDAGKIIAGLMRLLPENLASEMTFMTNFQGNGVARGVKLTFVNEYYPNQVYEATCEYVDLTAPCTPTDLETLYRDTLKKAFISGSPNEAADLSSWVSSDVAIRSVNKPLEFNMALFRYIYEPESFSFEMLDRIEGLIPELSSWINHDNSKASVVNRLFSEEYTRAETLDDFLPIKAVSDRAISAGIPMNDSLEASKEKMTPRALGNMKTLSSYYTALGPDISKYLNKGAFPSLMSVLKEIMTSDLPEEEKKALVLLLEPNYEERAKCYVSYLKNNPAVYEIIAPCFEWDKGYLDSVDWIKALDGLHSSEQLAPLFFNQIKRHPKGVVEQLKDYASFAGINPRFKALVQADSERIYLPAFDSFVALVSPTNADVVKTQIEQDVLPFVDEGNAKKKWTTLLNVLNGAVDGESDAFFYLKTAVKTQSKAAITAISDECFRSFSEQGQVFDFVRILLDNEIVSINEIKDRANALCANSEAKSYFWMAILKYGQFKEYDKMVALAEELGIDEETSDKHLKTFYKKAYSSHSRKLLMSKIKGVFKKKSVKIGGLSIIVVIALGICYCTIGPRFLKKPAESFSAPADSSLIIVADSTYVGAPVEGNTTKTNNQE